MVGIPFLLLVLFDYGGAYRLIAFFLPLLFFLFYRDTMDPFDVSDTLLTENFMQLDRKMERYGSGKQILLPTSRREIGVVIVAMAVVYL